MSGFSGFQPVGARLRGQGGEGGDEHCRQYLSGQVVGETAKTLSERFGKVLQKRQSISINRQDVSTSINTQMDALIPPSKISSLTQGMFVGSVSDNFNERIEQKIFHCEIVVDAEKVKRRKVPTRKFLSLPISRTRTATTE